MTLQPLGDLVAGRDGVLGFTVTATGTDPATGVTATLQLPAGVELTGTAVRSGAGFGIGGGASAPVETYGDWVCSGLSSVVCTGPDLQPGASSTVYLQVAAALGSGGGAPVTIDVADADLATATVTGAHGVAASGISARWAGNGQYAVTEVGAPLLTCPISATGCADAQKGNGSATLIDNNNWKMAPVDQDNDPATTDSSTANLDLKGNSDVVFAGLYWSGDTPDNTSDATLSSARLTGPTGIATDITAERVDHTTISTSTGYQSFADVTDLVNSAGAGAWTLANVAVAPGTGNYAGWALVVVYADASRPVGKVTVFEGFQAVNTGQPVPFTVAGTAGQAARIGLVAWEGDAGLDGDKLLLDNVALTPASGRQNPDNIADSTATGSSFVNSFGVDAKPLLGGTFTDDQASLVASTSSDTFVVGVVTVSSAD